MVADQYGGMSLYEVGVYGTDMENHTKKRHLTSLG